MFETVLVTGGAGAIGTNLVKELLSKAKKIIIVDNMDSGYEDLVPKDNRVELIKKSILDKTALDAAFKNRIEVIFHLAANFANANSIEHPEKDLSVNGTGTLRLLEYAHRHKTDKFIYASSSCVYGNVEGSVSEDTKELKLDTPYAITKLLGEQYVTFFHKHYALNTVILRIFNSFGPGERPGKYRNVIPNFFAKAMEGRSLIITGTGQETRDFNWVNNTVQGILLAAEKKEAIGQTFNVASGEATPIIKIAELINKITNNTAKIKFTEKRDWDKVINRKADISKIKQMLGYNPEIVLEKHIKLTYDWLRKNG